jgi:SAM-dependent methyltransferase
MDAPTLDFYTRQAASLSTKYELLSTDLLPHLALAKTFFRPGESVADLGCGSGRDAAWLDGLGYRVTGFDGSQGMLAEARRLHPGITFTHAVFPDLITIPADQHFQNLMCSAVLMHLPEDQLFAAIMRLSQLLEPGGRIVLTYRHSLALDERESDGRLFTSIIPGKLELMLGTLGLQVIYASTEPDSTRDHVHWQVVVAEKSSDLFDRGLDRLQGVLVQDKKDATYKLALLRALCDISRAEASLVVWREGSVYVPLSAIARWWLRYYWPFVTASDFVAQKRGEAKGNQRIAFRNALTELAQSYDGNLYSALHRMDETPTSFQSTLKTIANTIRVGPVQFAGGPKNRIFTYIRTLAGQTEQFGWVQVPESIWLDLTRYEHWIRDSVIIHWAELTADLNPGSAPGKFLPLLLEAPSDVRTTADVHGYFSSRPKPLVCVWSERPLQGIYDVDHLIPYSVWGNNDLWNLLPCDRQFNQRKRDALPSRALLGRQRDRILDYWQAYRLHWTDRFNWQLTRSLGRPVAHVNWESHSFAALQEVVERLATSRGLTRWEP